MSLLDSPDLWFIAGSTKTSNEAIDDLTDAEQRLQDAGYHQSHEQAHVELDHILWLYTLSPQVEIRYVAEVAV